MFNLFGRFKPNLDTLIARNKYPQAIEVMRQQFRRKSPDAPARQRFAELLILADRWAEAVPILLGLADEHIRFGFVDRARDALRRIEHVEPGRADVARRLSRIVGPAPEPSAGRVEVAPPPRVALASDEGGPVQLELAEPLPEHEPGLPQFVRDLARRGAEECAASGRPVLAAALLGDLDEDQLRPLLPGLHRRSYAAGDVILTEGESGDSVFLVAAGNAKVFVRSPHGRSFEVDQIDTLGFFGELAALSGRRREASIVAASACTLLEIEKRTLDALAGCRPEARQLLEEVCVERAMSPASAAVRSVPEDVAVERAAVALAAHFGESRWSVRMRLRLADLLLKAGNEKDALAILTGVAEDLAAGGRAEKAIAVLKKIEKIAHRHIEELCLAPLARTASLPDRGQSGHGEAPRKPPPPEEAFRGWLLNVLGDLKSAADDESGPVHIEIAEFRHPTTLH